ncbi:ABC transporter substrate-binding protein [Actinorugispora endophytica]|uniref:Peptide/nickel transport system substrate-binding protein n=1 Tax=Actinorugispora endophytica TaxID=1605990 RepID=A0A4R6V165_9ACTN|nr:ABC transporter substrate-binding protein [Actinorugispora endophytica]TDQ52258.1 peptide/nickel transport system substrate-binding protein [Actinorugispora endophytica]
MRSHPPARRLRAVSAAAVALAVLSSSGCFSGSGAPDGADADDRIAVAMLLPPRSALNPFTDDAFKLSRLGIAETLVQLDEPGDPQPMLATGWDRVDDTTWHFTLREGVTFHDGTPLTTDAVVTALTAATEAEPKPRILDGVEWRISAEGEDTVVIRSDSGDPLLPQRLSSPQLSILAPDAYGGQAVDPTGRGTGPFELVALNGGDSATLDRYEDYWDGTAAASGIDVSFVPDGTARAAALRTGEADIVEAIPPSQTALLEEGTFEEVPMPRTNTLYVNTRDGGPLADPGLRAAVREAVDAEPLVSDIYEDRADQAAGLLGPALPWADRRTAPEYAAEAADPDGEKLTLGTFSDRAELPEVAAVLEQQLEGAGFDVQLEIREYSQIEADALDGAFDLFVLSRATVLDSGDPVAYLVSDFSCEGGFNISGLCDPEVDGLLEDAAAEADLDERRDMILEAERAILETGAAVPMLHERVIQGNAPGVTGAFFDPRERLLVGLETTAGD